MYPIETALLFGFAFAFWAFLVAFNIFKSFKACFITAIIFLALATFIFASSFDILAYIIIGIFIVLTIAILIKKHLE